MQGRSAKKGRKETQRYVLQYQTATHGNVCRCSQRTTYSIWLSFEAKNSPRNVCANKNITSSRSESSRNTSYAHEWHPLRTEHYFEQGSLCTFPSANTSNGSSSNSPSYVSG